MSQKDRDMMKAYEKYEGENKRRINIVSITEMEDIKQWKKVTYGESMNKGWKWWWKSDDKDNIGDSSDKAGDKITTMMLIMIVRRPFRIKLNKMVKLKKS